MTTPEIDRIKNAVAAWKAAPTLAASFDAEDEYSHATDRDVMTAVLAHIDAQAAEIARLKAELDALDAAHRERRAALVEAIARAQTRKRVRRMRAKP